MEKTRYVRDPIYGLIYLPQIAWEIIDTPLFQRTRRIMQLGIAHYVYPSATHTRFSHMIGTAHLASLVVANLNSYISDYYKISIILAGLLHDIGHGPLSHIYEYVHQDEPKHEDRSIEFINYFKNEVPDISPYVENIKCIINGTSPDPTVPYIGQIIANHKTGIDVDKLDYMLRDCFFTGVKCTVDVDRIIKGMTIMNNNIVYQSKIIEDIANVFKTRYDLHRIVYKHKVVRILVIMVSKIIKLTGFKPNTIQDWISFTDDWFYQLRNHPNEHIKKIFNDIDKRKLWKQVNASNEYDIKYLLCIDSGYINEIPLDNYSNIDLSNVLPKEHKEYIYIKEN